MDFNTYSAIAYEGAINPDDEQIENLELENLGSAAFSFRSLQSVISTDRNNLKMHSQNSLNQSYNGRIPLPFEKEAGITLHTIMQQEQEEKRQMTPYEILVAREEPTEEE